MVDTGHWPSPEPRKWAALAFLLALPILSAQEDAPAQVVGRVRQFEKELQQTPSTGLHRPSGKGSQQPPGKGLQPPSGTGRQPPSGTGRQPPSGTGRQGPSVTGLQRPSGTRLQRSSRTGRQGAPGTGLPTPSKTRKHPQTSAWSQESELRRYQDDEELARRRKPLGAGCDLWSGRWLYDPSYPLYEAKSCRLGHSLYDCSNHSRPDTEYQHFRWQPDDCSIPRFNAAEARRRLRGKRLIFVGDSLAVNQLRSMVCMLSSDLPDVGDIEREWPKWESGKGWDSRFMYHFKRFNFTVEMYWSRFLARPEGVPAHIKVAPSQVKQVLDTSVMEDPVTSIVNASLAQGFGFDKSTILVVNSGHWWTEDQLSRKGIYYLAPNGRSVNTSIRLEEAYKASMRTAARWLLGLKQQYGITIMWRTYSPNHYRGGKWNTGGWCSAKLPLVGRTSPFLMIGPEDQKEDLDPVARKVMVAAGVPLLDIKALSNMRVDAHPGIYVGLGKPGKGKISDCNHWCLPGAADTWSELLMAQLRVNSLV